MKSLSPSNNKILFKILEKKKKKEIQFDDWLKKHECIVLSLNEFIFSCFNDNDLKNKYFAVRYPNCLHDDYFKNITKNYNFSGSFNPNVTISTTGTNTTTTLPSNIGNITLKTEDYTSSFNEIKVILILKELADKIIKLDSFENQN